ncbi:MAG: zinc ribbon domain-containing protein [candidate division KSB1 bacterium]|nr:zinc ribbon domain-containing protein [candidate division KSB1 bacterium]MDQ7063477.1 zinc ribbon domain-containing protein [candidate division KSB1 bacterium]
MIELIALSLAILTAIYIGYPFYKSRQTSMNFNVNHSIEDLEAQKIEIYKAIKDIEFDYEMGKLSREDFEQLRSQYKAEAVNILKQLDQIRPGQRRRATKTPAQAGQRFCAQCGSPVHAQDRFCSNCGAALHS